MRDTRKVIKIGDSNAITIPSQLKVGENCTLAASRLVLIDPRGEISPENLEKFVETYIDPVFWEWQKKIMELDIKVKEFKEELNSLGT